MGQPENEYLYCSSVAVDPPNHHSHGNCDAGCDYDDPPFLYEVVVVVVLVLLETEEPPFKLYFEAKDLKEKDSVATS